MLEMRMMLEQILKIDEEKQKNDKLRRCVVELSKQKAEEVTLVMEVEDNGADKVFQADVANSGSGAMD